MIDLRLESIIKVAYSVVWIAAVYFPLSRRVYESVIFYLLQHADV